MPTPETLNLGSVRAEPEEAGASGGALAEANPPQEFELVSIDQYGNRTVKRIWSVTYNFALKEAASEIYFDIAEEILRDLLAELPYPRFKARIYDTKGDVYKIEIKGRYFTKVLHVKKHRAIYYFGGMEIESSGGYPIFIPAEAVYHRRDKITYYEIAKNNISIDTIKEELEKLLQGEQL
jgi:stress-induced morphogen